MIKALVVVVGAALTLAACNSGSGNGQNNIDVNATVDPNAANMTATDQNGAMAAGPGGADMNTATNAEQEKMMNKDLHTNDKDTNLSNGM